MNSNIKQKYYENENLTDNITGSVKCGYRAGGNVELRTVCLWNSGDKQQRFRRPG